MSHCLPPGALPPPKGCLMLHGLDIIFRHDFQSCGRTMERKSLLFHVKASRGVWPYAPTTSIEQPSLLGLFHFLTPSFTYILFCCKIAVIIT